MAWKILCPVIILMEIRLSALIVVRPSSKSFLRDPGSQWDRASLWEGPPPYFLEDTRPTNVTAQLGQEVRMHCRVNNLGDKTVSWVKRHGQTFELLTFGHLTYSSEDRYSLVFDEPNDWSLVIKDAHPKDSGLYECQVSSHPPLARCTYLVVLVPLVEIVDSSGERVAERFYRLGTTIELTCVGTAPPSGARRMIWMFSGRALNHDTTRGGISVKTELTESGLVSQLHIAGARKGDAGSYECVLSDVSASAVVHVLAGEYADAMQYGRGDQSTSANKLHIILIVVNFIFHHFILPKLLAIELCINR